MTYSSKIVSISDKDWDIKLHGVGVRFEDFQALKNIDLLFESGSFTYIVGSNGAGKTTLIHVLLGMLQPTSGTIEINERVIGYLPQKLIQRQDIPMTVYEVVYSGMDKQSLRIPQEAKKSIDNWLEKMGLPGSGNRLMKSLSGGQAQRVFLCRALINDPDIIVLDEPTSALDPDFRREFNQLIDSLNEIGKTIIYVTHDLHEMKDSDKRVVHINQGIQFSGTLDAYFKYKDGDDICLK